MKAISLWQPWASAIALGAKTIETRSWSTSYRGPIAIHAAKRTNELIEIFVKNSELYADVRALREFQGKKIAEAFPLGSVVATARLVDCLPSEKITDLSSSNLILGDFSPGRFGWILKDIKALPEPLPYRGRQGLFEIPDSVFEASR